MLGVHFFMVEPVLYRACILLCYFCLVGCQTCAHEVDRVVLIFELLSLGSELAMIAFGSGRRKLQQPICGDWE